MVKQHTWLPTGASASLTGAGVSGSLVTSDAQHCQLLVGHIEDKRAMFAPMHQEHGFEVTNSLASIREYAKSVRYLVRSKTTSRSIADIQYAARDFMTTYRFSEHDIAANMELLDIALTSARYRILTTVLALVEKYDLETDLDLEPFRDSAVEVLRSWFKVEPWERVDPANEIT